MISYRLRILLLLSLGALVYFLLDSGALKRSVEFTPRVYGNIEGARITPTHVFFDSINNIEIVSDFSNNRFIYRNLSSDNNPDAWQQSEMASLRRPHAVTYHPTYKKYLAVDTANHQIIDFDSMSSVDENLQRYTELGGYELGKRPHDIAYNPVDDYVYVVLSHGVVRFRPSNSGMEEVTFVSKDTITHEIRKQSSNSKFAIGYMRAITVVDGVLYLINSTQGNIVRMEDFSDPDSWSAYINKHQSMKYVEAGSFEKDGLILNDIEYFNGYWYASNYYSSSENNYLGSAKNMTNKVIRWKSWDNFEDSEWEDLSHLVHPESIPYYFSRYEGRLFISMFHGGNKEGKGSGIYEISNPLF